MPRTKRVNNSSLPKSQAKTGRRPQLHKRGIAHPVARVVEMNNKTNPVRRRPEMDVMMDLVELLEEELQIELV